MARTDFRAAAARRLSEERELSPSIISLVSSDPAGRSGTVRNVPVERIDSNPENPRLAFDEATINELAASIKEHGVLQPILVRPLGDGRYQLIAGERRWRASKAAGIATIPALIEDIDDDTAMEIAIIENLQREDLSPLDEATMYDRMIREHGYSVRKLAQKLGKDKGYLENRLRLADAPEEVRGLVSVRKDTLSHAYELMKVTDPRKRKKLADQVARGELSLVKLREKIDGRPGRATRERVAIEIAPEDDLLGEEAYEEPEAKVPAQRQAAPVVEDSLISAKQNLSEAVDGLVDVLRTPDVVRSIGEVDRANLAKYLTIAKLRLENAIAMVRSSEDR